LGRDHEGARYLGGWGRSGGGEVHIHNVSLRLVLSYPLKMCRC
jgi:hypothetical protein